MSYVAESLLIVVAFHVVAIAATYLLQRRAREETIETREMWAMRTEKSPWEHFLVTDDHQYFVNGRGVAAYDFQEIYETAYRVSHIRSQICETEAG